MAVVWHLVATTDSILDARQHLASFRHPTTAVASVFGLLIATPDPRVHITGSLILSELVWATLQHAWAFTRSPEAYAVTDAYRGAWRAYRSGAVACQRLRTKVAASLDTQKASAAYTSLDGFVQDVAQFKADVDASLIAIAAPSATLAPLPMAATTPAVTAIAVPVDATGRNRVRLPQITRKPGSRGKQRKPKQRAKPWQVQYEEALRAALYPILLDRYAALRASIKLHFELVLEGEAMLQMATVFRRRLAVAAWRARAGAAKEVAANATRSHVYDAKMMTQVRLHKALTPAMQHIFYSELAPYNRLFNLFLDNSAPVDNLY
ncbi:hypothetical protein ACHHYP_13260 [Achlya hypogyna]|uniref:Uncharacterized protein n=1 Tax=Achlya hypogyna TaxID=1202772 RepID=A0A1V9YFR7_ACHHY|nr:hypothetical protein ACHHYP_13260 [Achlya hypogyna]